jgi:hypothetical protein
MEPRTNDEERLVNDAKVLVVALTEQLRNNALGEASRTQQYVPVNDASTRATLDSTTARDMENTGNSSLDINNDFCDQVEESFPLPDFLAESQVRAALHRAVNAHAQEAFSDEASPFSHFPTLRPAEMGGRDIGWQTLMARDFHPSLWHATLPHSSSPVPLSPYQERALESAEVASKFVPGHETESVLKLSKRPRLRPKDVSHRRSLAGREQGSTSQSAASLAATQSRAGRKLTR